MSRISKQPRCAVVRIAVLAFVLALVSHTPAEAACANVSGKAVLAPCAVSTKAWKAHGKTWRKSHVRIGAKVTLSRTFTQTRKVLVAFSDNATDGARWETRRTNITKTLKVRVAGKCTGKRWRLPRKVASRLGAQKKKVTFTWKLAA